MSVQTRTTALQNEIVRLYCQFEWDGRLNNPGSTPSVEIIDTDGVTVLDTITPLQEYTGVYYADWYVPANLPVGNYYDRWTYQWATTSSVDEKTMTFYVYALESYINFISPAISQVVSDRGLQMMKDLSNEFIYEAMHIPVYWEQAMRVQQENQQKRIKKYYNFTLNGNDYDVSAGAVYSNNSNRFTVFADVVSPESTSSASSYSSGSGSNTSSSSSYSTSSSSSSGNSNSSSSTSYSTESSTSSESNTESSTSAPTPVTTTTTTWAYYTIMQTVGTGAPSASGTLTKISGTGPATITYTGYTESTARFSTIYSLAYQNWNKDPRPIVRVDNRIVDDGWYADWNGRIFFDGLMAPEDSVNVAYNFAYFSDEEILSFLNMGLQIMNSTPPSSITYASLVGMPLEWNAPVLLYAAVLALKRLIFGLNFQEKMIIFGEPEAAQRAIATFQQLYQDYNTTWMEVKKNAKTQKLYGMAQYVTPEYTLPGGRCMSSDTYISCRVSNGKKQNLTIKDIFSLFENGKNISVLSLVDSNKAGYVPISKVWKSGNKTTYILKTKDTQIRLTKEHLVYMPKENNYKPVMDVTSDDSILVLVGKKLVEQKLISGPEKYKTEEVYDIEVPTTENFIGNNVVSHNSRWFRYLYKSS